MTDACGKILLLGFHVHLIEERLLHGCPEQVCGPRKLFDAWEFREYFEELEITFWVTCSMS
jgi:aminoglycoside N3'-acetyltransferase